MPQHYFRHAWFLFLLLVLGRVAVHAQNPFRDSTRYIPSYFSNSIKLAKQPFEWNKEAWLTAGGSLVFVGSMITFDEAMNSLMLEWDSPFAPEFGDKGSLFGEPSVQAGITAASLLVGGLSRNKHITHFGLDNLQAQLYTGALTMILKNLTHRSRPDEEKGSFSWFGPFHGWGNQSFNSGHTALAFSTANMLYLHSGRKWWVAALGFTAATATGVARMQQQEHWSSDVVMGAVLGTAVSAFVYKQQKQRRVRKETIQL